MEKQQNKKIDAYWILNIAGFAIFDLFAVNAAYFLALFARFHIGAEFPYWSMNYVVPFYQFAPWYTACCLIVFVVFRLYNSVWRYAGINDMNRIMEANLVTFIIQVAGSCIFVKRMPITYYVIGGVLQLALIAASRFAYRCYLMEIKRFKRMRNKVKYRALIVGNASAARMVMKNLERDKDNTTKPVCILNIHGIIKKGLLDGVPICSDTDKLKQAIERYRVNCVIIADPVMPKKTYETITMLCSELNLPMQTLSLINEEVVKKYGTKSPSAYADGPVVVLLNGTEKEFSSGSAAAQAINDGTLDTAATIAHARDEKFMNDISEDWVKEYMEETGEDVSFF